MSQPFAMPSASFPFASRAAGCSASPLPDRQGDGRQDRGLSRRATLAGAGASAAMLMLAAPGLRAQGTGADRAAATGPVGGNRTGGNAAGGNRTAGAPTGEMPDDRISADRIAADKGDPHPSARRRRYATIGGVALGGHDPVAYQQDGIARPGNPKHALKWRGVLWYFLSEENLSRFEMTPRNYAPALGGWAPLALAQGKMVVGDPTIFEIWDGRLYLLENETQREVFHRDPEAVIAAARRQWQAIPPG